MLAYIPVDTMDLQNVEFLNNDSQILVWDNPLEADILIYNIHDRSLKVKIDCNCVGLGIKSLCVSPDRKFISAGLFDTNINVYGTATFNMIAKL
jgi:hypothetical protein